MVDRTPKKCITPTHGQNVSLKEYIEEKFAALDRLRGQEAETLKIQAAEYERRLDGLNHEAQRINAASAASISREVFETFLKGDASWKSQSEKDRGSHMPRLEYEAKHQELSSKINTNAQHIAILETSRGRVDIMQIFSVASSLAAVASVVYVLVTRH